MKTNKENTTEASDQFSEIWIVEDNVFYRTIIKEYIDKTTDLRCSQFFSSCEEALHNMESNPSPDILLLDIGLPGMSGLTGIEKFKQQSPSLQIIILTVHEDSDIVFQAICAGAVGYLLKETPEEKIIEAIYEVLQGGSPMNTQIARKVLTAFTALNPTTSDYGLTNREQEILGQMIKGSTKKEIGDSLFLSHHTIDYHIRNIYTKLQVNNRSEAVAKALKERIL
jgi:DNA-binding NarL/FixJ family response regulator